MANGKSLSELESAVLDGKNKVCAARVELELATEALEETFKAAGVAPEQQQKLLFELDIAIHRVIGLEKELAVAEDRFETRKRGLS